jgi:hypothetical protein
MAPSFFAAKNCQGGEGYKPAIIRCITSHNTILKQPYLDFRLLRFSWQACIIFAKFPGRFVWFSQTPVPIDLLCGRGAASRVRVGPEGQSAYRKTTGLSHPGRFWRSHHPSGFFAHRFRIYAFPEAPFSSRFTHPSHSDFSVPK